MNKNIIFLDNKLLIDKLSGLNDVYWNNAQDRWKYMSVVVEELKTINPISVLELGAYKINLTSISDNMDKRIDFIDSNNINNKKYIQDAINLPWNIPDKYYDVFVALQVFEHLENKQSEVFEEVKRISKNAIISLPYKWNQPGNCHHMIDEDIIKEWTKIKPNKSIIIEKRIICIYNF